MDTSINPVTFSGEVAHDQVQQRKPLLWNEFIYGKSVQYIAQIVLIVGTLGLWMDYSKASAHDN